MRLAELSPAERRYLSSPLPPVDTWTPILIARLCGVLGARMKQRVQIFAVAPDPLAIDAVTERPMPDIQWDDQLDAMWTRARLGGSACITTRCVALSRNLLRTLEQALAEIWMSSAQNKMLPRMLRLQIELIPNADVMQPATLAIYFPATSNQMDRWAQRLSAS